MANRCSDAMLISIIYLLAHVFCAHVVEGSRGYSFADCTYLKENQNTTHFGTRCFCYSSGTVIKWKDIWSTFEVCVTGDEGVYIVYPMETRNCYEPDNVFTLSKCLLDHYWPPSVEKEKRLDIPLEQEDVCFMVKTPRANTEHILHVKGKRLNKTRFGFFACGLTLFYFAGTLCRSSFFFYTSGISLGIISIIVFLLFILKSFIPTRGLFLTLFGAGSGLSYLGCQTVLSHWEEIMTLYWRQAFGYLVLTGLVSFAVCYKHGGISSERTLSLLTWGLQSMAMGLIYYGVTYPLASYTLLGALLGLKCVPYAYRLLLETCRLLGSLLSGLGRRRPQVRLLTEEEYREQGEMVTKASLEELREDCTKPGFPAWDTVLKLSKPQRFADFVKWGAHVTKGESQCHELQYGLGGAYYEDLLFNHSHRARPQQGADDDISEDEMDSYIQDPPTPNPLYTSMPRPDTSAPCPPSYIAPPYPTYTPPFNLPPVPSPMEDEDMELF